VHLGQSAVVSAEWRVSGSGPELVVAASPPEFGALFETHNRPAYRLALLLCGGDTALAEDAVSEAFAGTYPKWLAGGIDDFGPYLRRAVVNQVRGTFRRRLVQRRELHLLGGDEGGRLSGEDRVDERDALWRALRLLPLKQRTAVVLHYYDDRTLEEVADLMGTTLGTAKAHVSRGRDRLRALLGGGEDR